MALFPSKNSLRGNVLFIVLLGVVLFGALSYAVVNSNSDSGDTGSAEQARIYAGEIVRYAQSMRAAVDRMRMNGVSENDIRFAHPDLDAAYGTLGTTPKNEVFHPDGGGMNYLTPKQEWLNYAFSGDTNFGDWIFNSRNYIMGVGSNAGSCSQSDCYELVMLLPYLNKETCVAINNILAAGAEDADPDQDTGSILITHGFNGTYIGPAKIDGTNADLNGLKSYCLQGDIVPPAGSYIFYTALIER